MAKFVAVRKHGAWRVVYQMAIGEGFPPELVVEKIKETAHQYSGQQEAEQEADRLNQALFPTYLVVPFARRGMKGTEYMVARVKRNKDGQATGRELNEMVYEDAEAAQQAFLHNLRWTPDCLANRKPEVMVNGVKITPCTKQGIAMIFWYRGLLPNGRLMDFDIRRLGEVLGHNLNVIVRDGTTIQEQRIEIGRFWESIPPSFDLAAWIEQWGSESYLNLDR